MTPIFPPEWCFRLPNSMKFQFERPMDRAFRGDLTISERISVHSAGLAHYLRLISAIRLETGGKMKNILAIAALTAAIPALAQAPSSDSQAPAATAPRQVTLPMNTLVEVTPANEITSKRMKEGTTREFLVARDVVEQGVVVIPRGAPVTAEVTWRTGKGVVGKSAKFELTFRSVRLSFGEKRLRGMHRQEGRGNTAGALLGATFITGKSATMVPGQIVNVFTAEPIVVP